MKFLADMGISPRVVSELRAMGHDALHLQEEGLGRLPDQVILEKARDEGRVLWTHDLDFGELLAASRSALPSVIIFRLRDMRSESVLGYLKAILIHQEEALKQGVICSVTERKIRLRSLPVR